jgi:hypothetical protein
VEFDAELPQHIHYTEAAVKYDQMFRAAARARFARVRELLLLPYPNLRHLKMGWKEAHALETMRLNLNDGQLETCESQEMGAYHPPLELSSASVVEGMSTATDVVIRFGPARIASIEVLAQVLARCPLVRAAHVVVDVAMDSETDNVVACVAKMTNWRLREFSVMAAVQEDAVQLSDEGITHLVAHCPLMEQLSLRLAARVTEVSMRLMHARWMHTLRYLDVSGTPDGMYRRLAESWQKRLPGLDMCVNWFVFDEGFAD